MPTVKKITADEFEARHAKQRGVSIAELRAEGRLTKPCDCDYVGCEGWQWVSREQALREEGVVRRPGLLEAATAIAEAVNTSVDFELTMRQVQANVGRPIPLEFRTLVGGRRTGRRASQEEELHRRAATSADADAAVSDLRDHGIALLDDSGRRIKPPHTQSRLGAQPPQFGSG